MNLADLNRFIGDKWDHDLVPRLVDYVRVPAKSPAFDASWQAHGYLQAVVKDAEAWCRAQAIAGLTIEVVVIEGRTPCLLFDVPATQGLGNDRTVLFYGHLDKQPEMTGWRDDLGPWKPVIEDGKLYGRGSADDGYAIYAALTTIAAIDAQGAARPRCVGIIETCEESGSPDLPEYLQLLAPRFGDVQLVVGTRLRLPKLRATVGDDVAARTRRRHADRRDPVRRRALGARERHRAVIVPDRATAAEPAR